MPGRRGRRLLRLEREGELRHVLQDRAVLRGPPHRGEQVHEGEPRPAGVPVGARLRRHEEPRLTHDAVTGADLTPFPRAGGNSVILDPSIQEVLANEYDETLIAEGLLRQPAGKVTVGSGELVDQVMGRTTRSSARCPRPARVRTATSRRGPGRARPQRKSNVHQLTEWDIPLHYLWTDAYGLHRAQVRRQREAPLPGRRRQLPREAPRAAASSRSAACCPTKDSSLPPHRLRLPQRRLVHDDTERDRASSRPDERPACSASCSSQALKVDANTPHLGGLGLAVRRGCGSSALQVHDLGRPELLRTVSVAPAFGLLEGQMDFPSPARGLPGSSAPRAPADVRRPVPHPREEVHRRRRSAAAHRRVDPGRGPRPAREIRPGAIGAVRLRGRSSRHLEDRARRVGVELGRVHGLDRRRARPGTCRPCSPAGGT